MDVQASAGADVDASVLFRKETVRLPVVMYHLVTNQGKYVGRYGITPDALDSDLKYLKDNGYNTVVMKDVSDFITKGVPLPEKPVMLTFDDGNSSDHTYVLPLLKKHNVKVILSVMGKQADQYTSDAVKYGGGTYPNLTWPQLKEIVGTGLAEIQSHAYDLHSAGGAGRRHNESMGEYQARLRKDLSRLQECCAQELGVRPDTFTYPLGVYGQGSEEVLKGLGFVASFSCTEGINEIKQGEPEGLFMLKRCIRSSGKHISEILNKYGV
jgi:peptidoglycan/xylan/chitin deacetylase (PgdA/CDA1 family)